jgi:hypothetical protein
MLSSSRGVAVMDSAKLYEEVSMDEVPRGPSSASLPRDEPELSVPVRWGAGSIMVESAFENQTRAFMTCARLLEHYRATSGEILFGGALACDR